MTIIPAIDLLNGKTVRLLEGSYDAVTTYAVDPVEVARGYVDAGATRIHVVDLDAARGSGDNRDQIERICRSAGVAIEVGGGVRSESEVERLFSMGVRSVVVGSSLVKDPDSVRSWCARWAGRIIAAIDARDGIVMVSGWQNRGGASACEIGKLAYEIGVAEIQFTNIARDGTFAGPDIDGTREIARCSRLPVVLSGGIATIDDVYRVAEFRDEIGGVIIGRALYEGRIDLSRAIEGVHR